MSYNNVKYVCISHFQFAVGNGYKTLQIINIIVQYRNTEKTRDELLGGGGTLLLIIA